MYIDGSDFKDKHGRTLMLRGVNLGGSSKVPLNPDGSTYLRENFYDHRQVSFIGRPFPLVEADEHFSRLKSWGLTFLRLIVTWEAIEYAGPGIYDRGYLAYIRALVEKAGDHGINMFIDPHQDVWSRFSGGDGAPGWTFEMVGLDITTFQETGAAFTHQAHGDPLPQMIWSTNATKLAAATMFTLFFGGKDFAPLTKIDGESTQDYFQNHYIKSIQILAKELIGLPNLVGFDTMNEPVEGWIGISDLTKRHTTVEKGFIPTPFEAMQLGAGCSLKLNKWERGLLGPRVVGRELINPARKRVWLDGFDPIWQKNGVWKMIGNQPVLLQPDHFAFRQGRRIDFNRDYYVPFNNKFAEQIRKVQPKTIIFVEKGFGPEGPELGPEDASNIVYAPHWYDPVVLVMKRFISWLNYDWKKNKLILGRKRVERSFKEQLARPLSHAREKMGGIPVLIGEVGIAYDLDNKSAYRTGDFGSQVKALDRTIRALEENLHHFTLWNYTSDNTNLRGDQWNDEDLSIFSRDQQNDPGDINSGGRALNAVIRPYPLASAGKPLRMEFDIETKGFEFVFEDDPIIDQPTLIFVPEYHYGNRVVVEISDGSFQFYPGRQILEYIHQTKAKRHTIRIKPGLESDDF